MRNCKLIKYVAFYDETAVNSDRYRSIAACKKIEYILDVCHRKNIQVNLVSTSWKVRGDSVKFVPIEYRKVSSSLLIKFLPSIFFPFRCGQAIAGFLSQFFLFYELMFNTSRNDIVMAYHSTSYSVPLLLSRFVIGYKLVLEVEEIYTLVWGGSRFAKFLERYCLEQADSYIFATKKLSDLVRLGSAQSILLHGDYRRSAHNSLKDSKGEISLIYAGSIEKVRCGAFISLDVIAHLPINFRLSIIGTGLDEDLDELRLKILNINSSLNRQACLYCGVKSGYELDQFVSGHHIGLNPQVGGAYMDSAFPSKIISYLSCGLSVVSSPIQSVIDSDVSGHVIFSSDDTPLSLSKAVLSATSSLASSGIGDFIENLDDKFGNNFQSEINDLCKDSAS